MPYCWRGTLCKTWQFLAVSSCCHRVCFIVTPVSYLALLLGLHMQGSEELIRAGAEMVRLALNSSPELERYKRHFRHSVSADLPPASFC